MSVTLRLMAFAFLASAPVAAAVFTVNDVSDAVDASPGNGVCATATGTCTLRAAVMETNALIGTHTINLPAGLYTLTIPGTSEEWSATGDLNIRNDVSLVGAGPDLTVVDARGIDRVFEVIGTARILGIAIRGGVALSPGNPFLGFSWAGGLIENLGTLSLTNCTLSGGRAVVGGAVWSGGLGTLSIDRCTIRDNDAENSDVGASNPTVGNYSKGGGLAVRTPTTITNSTISGNWAQQGGGIEEEGGSVTLLNVTLSGNYGGPSWASSSAVLLRT